MTPPATVAQGESKPYVKICFGIDAKRPPCIAALESDGAVHGDTVEALKVLALWQKEIVNANYKGKGSSADPFTSFLDGDVALPMGDHLDNLVRWASEKCRAPISREDAEGIISEVAEGDLSFSCDRAKKLSPSVAEFCEPGACKVKAEASTEGKGEEVPDELKDLASLILREGKPLDLITDSCERFVLGARSATRKLVCCEMVQMVPSSRGLHPKLSGESGSGKTWCLKVFLHHLPSDAYVAGGLTPKALAYHMLGDKLFIVLDDYVPSEDLDTIMKVTSSNFHRPYLHRTVKRQEGVTLEIGKEMTWCVTSVDSRPSQRR
jgi:hypothetical protein